MRTTLDIEDRLLREAKSVAAQHGTTLTAIIEQALRRLLEGNAGKPSAKKIGKLPPLPLAKPGKGQLIDLASNQRIAELLDEHP
jgi:hypothetical protein